MLVLPTVQFNCLIYKLNCGGCQLTKITAWSKIISMYGNVQVSVRTRKHVSVPEISKFRYLIKFFSEINLDYSTILHFEHSAWQKGVCTTWTKRILMGPSLYRPSLIYITATFLETAKYPKLTSQLCTYCCTNQYYVSKHCAIKQHLFLIP